MIGVIAKEAHKAVVAEFFQLFKTPWEFWENNKTYSTVLSTLETIPKVNSDLLIVYSGKKMNTDASDTDLSAEQYQNIALDLKGEILPIYGDLLTFNKIAKSLIRADNLSDAMGIEFDEGGQKVFWMGYDLFDEIIFLLTTGQPVKNAHIPTLEIHAQLLRKLLLYGNYPVIEILPTPAGFGFIACLTHDVDFIRISDHWFDPTFFGFFYRAIFGSLSGVINGKITLKRLWANFIAVLSLPLIYLGFKKDIWLGFEQYMEIEQGLEATYFFIPFKNRPGHQVPPPNAKRRATKYDIEDAEPWISRLMEHGHEIAVHGIDSWNNSAAGEKERDRFHSVTGLEVSGIRMHWLLFDQKSPKKLETAGYAYDASSGYNETIGFRAGTTQVFQPLGTDRFSEIPLHIQDVALFYPSFLNLSEPEAMARCRRLIKQVTEYGGVLTLLWHLRSLAPERLWKDFYVRLIDDLKKKAVWFASAKKITEWFRLRRAIHLTWSLVSENTIRVTWKSPGNIENAKFVLRAYHPCPDTSDVLNHPLTYENFNIAETNAISFDLRIWNHQEKRKA